MIKKIVIISSAILCLVGLCLCNAYIVNPKQLKVREETLSSTKIDNDLDGLIIVYFSDLYYGKFVDDDYLNKLVVKINRFNPDVVIYGGDLLENDEVESSKLLQALSNIKTTNGKYFILGDNDSQKSKDILLAADFKLIDNSSKTINVDYNSFINLINVNSIDSNVEEAFKDISENTYNILITHYPDTFTNITDQYFDYCLAGHSLGGQVNIPLINLFDRPHGASKYLNGIHKSNNKTIDVTNGTGRKLNNVRFLADNEIVVYRLDSISKIEPKEKDVE
ncbi:MAG: hypothetical protein Q4E33_02025 [Erysipelotrichaceae bacterium]|nr:hypothetical protein [Erysipelotrichaceae bacterium]